MLIGPYNHGHECPCYLLVNNGWQDPTSRSFELAIELRMLEAYAVCWLVEFTPRVANNPSDAQLSCPVLRPWQAVHLSKHL